MIMKKMYIILTKFLICVILFLGLAIMCKRDSSLEKKIYNKFYEKSISFSYFKNFYDKYLGGVFPIEQAFLNESELVFSEQLLYDEIYDYNDGVALKVVPNYLVPAIYDGIVVYVGEKDKYGNVVIMETNNGVNVWYGNLCNVNVKMYDSLVSGTYLGEVCNNMLYLVFSKGNNFLDYSEYLE